MANILFIGLGGVGCEPRDGLAGPVAGVLMQAGQGVEDGALAGIWIARQCDHIVVADAAQLHGRRPILFAYGFCRTTVAVH